MGIFQVVPLNRFPLLAPWTARVLRSRRVKRSSVAAAFIPISTGIALISTDSVGGGESIWLVASRAGQVAGVAFMGRP